MLKMIYLLFRTIGDITDISFVSNHFVNVTTNEATYEYSYESLKLECEMLQSV